MLRAYHSSTSTISDPDLEEAMRYSCGTNVLVDAFGLTPFHVLVTSANLRNQMLECLIDNGGFDAQGRIWKYHVGLLAAEYIRWETPFDPNGP
ncbi:unnamed protein product [Cylindrotheca closterium]|uniref:Uncharacterized protein n=1 Tax=Cylindrotheca closterium TaxID=2856 RepID=A0AAD2G3Z9_9STRA|nr:unnamed protein product [Cylindrotheca closterium]